MKERVLADPLRFLALGFGAGLVPRMPGTAGTVVAVPLYWLIRDLPLPGYLGCVLLAVGIGVWVCGETARFLKVHDHPSIVWDEVTGYLITMIGAPAGGAWWLLGFAAFRVLDIIKPWPIGWADRRVHGGLGIMLDDILAGLIACAFVHVVRLSIA